MGANQGKSQGLGYNRDFAVNKQLGHVNNVYPSETTSQNVSVNSEAEDVFSNTVHSPAMTNLDVSGSQITGSAASIAMEMVVALYDFQASLESQVSLKRGDQLHLLSLSGTGEWAEIEAWTPDGNHYRRGWVPASYLAPIPPELISPTTGWLQGRAAGNQSGSRPPSSLARSSAAGDTDWNSQSQQSQQIRRRAPDSGSCSSATPQLQSKPPPGPRQSVSTQGTDTPTSNTLLTSLVGEAWFHKGVGRQGAESLLYSGINGSFLVRDSESESGQLSITVRYEGRVYHYRVSRDNTGLYYVTETHKFPTIQQLVDHHSRHEDGLVCALLYPAPKRHHSTNNNNNNNYQPQKSNQSSNSNNNGVPVTSNSYWGSTSANGSAGGRTSSYSLIEDNVDGWEIDRTEIIMRHKLGGGQYGDVYEALWKRCNTVVAVKTVKEDVPLKVNDFLEEAAVMKTLKHENLVTLLGVCTREPPLFLVTEFMSQGNLLHFLISQPRSELPPSLLLKMTRQIAAGCAYLEKNNFVHRDLAARNCLVGSNYTVKVGDFGLARYLNQCQGAYTGCVGGKLPIKWTAPEGLAFSHFSTASDVWSLGIVLWEVATYGQTPYPGIELAQVYHLLEKGYRMPMPRACPHRLYALMRRCWAWNAGDRPTLAAVHEELKDMSQNSNVDQEVARELEKHHQGGEKKRSRSTDPCQAESPTLDIRASPANSMPGDRRSPATVVTNQNPVSRGLSQSNHTDRGSSRRTQNILPRGVRRAPTLPPNIGLVGAPGIGRPPPDMPFNVPGLTMAPPLPGNEVAEHRERDGRETPDESGVGDSIVSTESPANHDPSPQPPLLHLPYPNSIQYPIQVGQVYPNQGPPPFPAPSGALTTTHGAHQQALLHHNARLQHRSLCAAHRARKTTNNQGTQEVQPRSHQLTRRSQSTSNTPPQCAPSPGIPTTSPPGLQGPPPTQLSGNPSPNSVASTALGRQQHPISVRPGTRNQNCATPPPSNSRPPDRLPPPYSAHQENNSRNNAPPALPSTPPITTNEAFYSRLPSPPVQQNQMQFSLPTQPEEVIERQSPDVYNTVADSTVTSPDSNYQVPLQPHASFNQYDIYQSPLPAPPTDQYSLNLQRQMDMKPQLRHSQDKNQPMPPGYLQGVLDEASLGQFSTLPASDRIGRYLDSMRQDQKDKKAQGSKSVQPTRRNLLLEESNNQNAPMRRQNEIQNYRPISEEYGGGDEDDKSVESNTEEVSRCLDDTLSIASDSPMNNLQDNNHRDHEEDQMSDFPSYFHFPRNDNESKFSEHLLDNISFPMSSLASQYPPLSKPSALPVSQHPHCTTNADTPTSDNPQVLPSTAPHLRFSQTSSTADNYRLLDSVNDLILQSEFLCATYPKLASDLANLSSQLAICSETAVQFAVAQVSSTSRHHVNNDDESSQSAGETSEEDEVSGQQMQQILSACVMLDSHVVQMRQFGEKVGSSDTDDASGAKTQIGSSAEVNQCLENVQIALAQLKKSIIETS